MLCSAKHTRNNKEDLLCVIVFVYIHTHNKNTKSNQNCSNSNNDDHVNNNDKYIDSDYNNNKSRPGAAGGALWRRGRRGGRLERSHCGRLSVRSVCLMCVLLLRSTAFTGCTAGKYRRPGGRLSRAPSAHSAQQGRTGGVTSSSWANRGGH